MSKNWKDKIIEQSKINPNVCKDVLYDKTAFQTKKGWVIPTKKILKQLVQLEISLDLNSLFPNLII